MILVARDPTANRSLIRFAIWSGFVREGIMPVQGLVDETARANPPGDIPAPFLVDFVLWSLMPRRARA